MASHKPIKPADNVLAYIKANYKYDPNTGHITGNKGKIFRNVDTSGYIQIDLSRLPNGRFLKGHHVAWFLYYGEWPTEELDHDDRNKINNRIENLYESSRRDQITNSRRSDGRELPIGVVIAGPTSKPYAARIGINYKVVHLGYFATAEEAGIRYLEEVNKLRGQNV